jgi:hypothetical protein
VSDRRGSSRVLGTARQCAVFVRGDLRCVWCRVELRRPRRGGRDPRGASIDHYDGDSSNNAADNLLAACRGCNTVRRWLEMDGDGHVRAQRQLAESLDLAAGAALAERWHPGRLEQVRACRARWLARQRGELPAAWAFGPEEAA